MSHEKYCLNNFLPFTFWLPELLNTNIYNEESKTLVLLKTRVFCEQGIVPS